MSQTEAQTMMQYDIQKKSAVVAYLLWWFLGSFGAHRFYLGRIGSAVCMLMLNLMSFVLLLVVIGIFGYIALGIWWLIDAFLVYFIVKEHNTQLALRLGANVYP